MNNFLNKAKERSFALEKGIAYYMYRELIEDLHSEYSIPDYIMAKINKRSVDRAMAVVKSLKGDELALRALICQAILTEAWDDPCDEVYKKLRCLGEMLAE